MTDTELDEILRQIVDRDRRTTFPPSADDAAEHYHAHGEHAEYGASQH